MSASISIAVFMYDFAKALAIGSGGPSHRTVTLVFWSESPVFVNLNLCGSCGLGSRGAAFC